MIMILSVLKRPSSSLFPIRTSLLLAACTIRRSILRTPNWLSVENIPTVTQVSNDNTESYTKHLIAPIPAFHTFNEG